MLASFAACSICSMVMSVRPCRMLSEMDTEKRTAPLVTMATWWRSHFRLYSRMSTPSIRICRNNTNRNVQNTIQVKKKKKKKGEKKRRRRRRRRMERERRKRRRSRTEREGTYEGAREKDKEEERKRWRRKKRRSKTE